MEVKNIAKIMLFTITLIALYELLGKQLKDKAKKLLENNNIIVATDRNVEVDYKRTQPFAIESDTSNKPFEIHEPDILFTF